MDYKLNDVLIEAKSLKEKQYCKDNSIELRRLKNGITIVGIPTQMDNAAWAEVEWQFPVGSYGNPAGQVHFLEHFFNKKINKLAEKNNVNVNAFTSQIGVSQVSKGVCNPEVIDFGIWEILPHVRTALENPIDKDSKIESEKKVIADEIIRGKNDHDSLVGRHFRDVVYAKDNPILDEPLVTGEIKDIEEINFKSLQKITENVLIPDGLIISVYTQGEKKATKMLVDKVQSLFEDFPRVEKRAQRPNPKLRDSLNSDFMPGKIYTRNTGIHNNRITFSFVWQLNVAFPEIDRFALGRITSPLYANLHEVSRIAGWGYRTDVYTNRPSYNVAFLMLRVDTNKVEDVEKFAKDELLPAIKNSVIGQINKKIIQEICDLEDKKQRAIPSGNRDRLEWAIDGIRDFGKIVDEDILKKIYLEIKPEHLAGLIKEISTTPPAIIITGDL